MTASGTALLLGILAVVAVGLLVSTRPDERPTLADDAPPLLDAPAAEVVRIEVADPVEDLVVLRREGGWTDEHGNAWSRDAVESLLATLATLRPIMVAATGPADPQEYGLGPTSPVLRVLTRDGATALRLQVGGRNPAWTGRYVRRHGATDVLLVGGLLGWELDKLRAGGPSPQAPS